MTAILSGCLWLPLNSVDRKAVEKMYTVKVWDMGEKDPKIVPAYVIADGYIGVPRQDGLKLISEMKVEDERSMGERVKFPKKPTLRSNQVDFVGDMLRASKSEYSDFVGYAATGKGKTVCALAVAAELGRTFLAVVDQERLMEQWIKRAQEHLGLDVDIPAEEIMKGKGVDIGVVQGPLCKIEGRKMVVAMVQSLSQRQYPEELYEWPGVVCFDEAHVAGAPIFSIALRLFSAKVRFGVSATPERPDDLKKMILWNLGEVEAHLGEKHKKSRVYYVESDAVVSWYANVSKMTGRYINELASNPERNRLLTDIIIWLHGTGRDVLIVSDRIEQLCNLMALCRARGVADEDMGLYARYREVWAYRKNPTPKTIPKDAPEDYVPMHWAADREKVSSAKLKQTMEGARLIFATFKMFEKGVDLPRLSAGVDCTPHSRATQVHGRILRTDVDKKTPIWVTLRDTLSYRAEYQFLQRLNDYVNSNAEVFLWQPDKGVMRQDVGDLRREVTARIQLLRKQTITTRADGSSMLPILHTQRDSVRPPALRTERTTRSRRAA